ncbi:LysR substrate-binding domain-containing protein [Longispora urticae]
MLERHEIEAFLAVADELHFGRAAARLRITTGRVSQTVKRLERQIGAPLFDRTSRKVALTPIGRQLAADLGPLVAGIDDAVRRAVDAGRGVTGTLRVGFLGAGTGQLALRSVALFSSRYPDCEVHVHEAQLLDTRASLDDGRLDVLFASYPFDGMASGPALTSEARTLAVAADHPLARARSVSLEVLADHPVVQLPAVTSDAFKRDRTPDRTPSGRPVPRGPVGATFTEILNHVAMRRGVYIVGEHTRTYYPRPDIVYVPIRDAPPIECGPVWRETNTTARVRAFVQAAADAHPRP